jgi:hypothetical protein
MSFRAETCVVGVLFTTRRAFLFSSSSSARARFPSLEPSRRTRERAALDFLGAGLRLIPLAGQRTGRGGRARARRIYLGRGRAGKRWFGWPSRARPSRCRSERFNLSRRLAPFRILRLRIGWLAGDANLALRTVDVDPRDTGIRVAACFFIKDRTPQGIPDATVA